MPTLERAGAKHNDLVKQLTRTRAKRDKAVATLARLEAKHNSLIRAVTRSQKRLGKLRIVASVNAPMDDVFNDSEMPPPAEMPPTDSLDIPDFLQR